MVFMLVIADALVPSQACALPARLRELLKPGRIASVLCLGNCSREIIGLLKGVTNDVKRVRGDDDLDGSIPDTRVVEVEGLRLGLCHGHQVVPSGNEQALLALQREMDVDVLLTAATHELSVVETNGALLINPGSATGAATLLHDNPPPSFIVMDVSAGKVLMWTYQMQGEHLSIQRHEYAKPGFESPTAAVAAAEGGDARAPDSGVADESHYTGQSQGASEATGDDADSAHPAASNAATGSPAVARAAVEKLEQADDVADQGGYPGASDAYAESD